MCNVWETDHLFPLHLQSSAFFINLKGVEAKDQLDEKQLERRISFATYAHPKQGHFNSDRTNDVST